MLRSHLAMHCLSFFHISLCDAASLEAESSTADYLAAAKETFPPKPVERVQPNLTKRRQLRYKRRDTVTHGVQCLVRAAKVVRLFLSLLLLEHSQGARRAACQVTSFPPLAIRGSGPEHFRPSMLQSRAPTFRGPRGWRSRRRGPSSRCVPRNPPRR